MSSNAARLTVDRMRADIAAILNETPAAIGDDENLMDLGLDSLRAMALVTAWSGNGIDYEFGEFAAVEPTLAGWWGIVAARQAAHAGES